MSHAFFYPGTHPHIQDKSPSSMNQEVQLNTSKNIYSLLDMSTPTLRKSSNGFHEIWFESPDEEEMRKECIKSSTTLKLLDMRLDIIVNSSNSWKRVIVDVYSADLNNPKFKDEIALIKQYGGTPENVIIELRDEKVWEAQLSESGILNVQYFRAMLWMKLIVNDFTLESPDNASKIIDFSNLSKLFQKWILPVFVKISSTILDRIRKRDVLIQNLQHCVQFIKKLVESGVKIQSKNITTPAESA